MVLSGSSVLSAVRCANMQIASRLLPENCSAESDQSAGLLSMIDTRTLRAPAVLTLHLVTNAMTSCCCCWWWWWCCCWWWWWWWFCTFVVSLVHSTWTELMQIANSSVNSRTAILALRTNSPSFAAANQVWRRRAWPMSASCNWVELLQVRSGQFMRCEQTSTSNCHAVSSSIPGGRFYDSGYNVSDSWIFLCDMYREDGRWKRLIWNSEVTKVNVVPSTSRAVAVPRMKGQLSAAEVIAWCSWCCSGADNDDDDDVESNDNLQRWWSNTPLVTRR